MKRLTMSGYITQIKTGVSQSNEPWAQLSIQDVFIKRDGTQQVITEYVSTFNKYLIDQINAGAIAYNMPVVIEADVRAELYNKQDGTPGAKLSYVANAIYPIRFPQAQQATQPSMNQQMVNQANNMMGQPAGQQPTGMPNLSYGNQSVSHNGTFTTTQITHSNGVAINQGSQSNQGNQQTNGIPNNNYNVNF